MEFINNISIKLRDRRLFYCLAVIIGVSIPTAVFSTQSCSRTNNCLSTDLGYIVGSSSIQRDKASESMRYSGERFREMTGKYPPVGTVILNHGLAAPMIPRLYSTWSLPYYPAAAARFELNDDKQKLIADGKRASDLTGVFGDLSNRDSLSHEICHKLVQVAAEGRKIPMAFQETIAVGCEDEGLRNMRIREGVGMKVAGFWPAFIASEHPLSRLPYDPSEHQQLQNVGVVRIEISGGTRIGLDVSKYYARSAMLEKYLELGCERRHTIGLVFDVIKKYGDIRSIFRQNTEGCIGRGSEELSSKIDIYFRPSH